MVQRNIVKIDESKCNGCGQCVTACAEGAIQMIDGKAKLVSDTYCDGLGACLGHCPQDAITVEQREADEFDAKAAEEFVEKLKSQQQPKPAPSPMACGCPGMMAKSFEPAAASVDEPSSKVSAQSALGQWPVQLKLLSPNAPYLIHADLLITADCVPFAMADYHSKFLKGKAVVVGCPKLDDVQHYVQKIADIVKANDLSSITVLHMEVPCCSGLTRLVGQAIVLSGIDIKFEDVTVSLRGDVISRETISVNHGGIHS